MTIKAIETVYNGYKFRSRLEARWALFFDTLGIKYQYEMEGFELGNGIKYLPDFLITVKAGSKDDPFDINFWVEIKPNVSETYQDKLSLLCEQTRRPGLLIQGTPWPNEYKIDFFDYDGTRRHSDPYTMVWACHKSGNAGLIEQNHNGSAWNSCIGVTANNPGDYSWPAEFNNFDMTKTDKITCAYIAARQARFEHGETPNGKF